MAKEVKRYHCQACDDWVTGVTYNWSNDRDECKDCREDFKYNSAEFAKKAHQMLSEMFINSQSQK
jgi:hypothetical protein